MKSNNELSGCIGLIAVFLIGAIGLVLWSGYVLSTAWGLLLVPLFGLPPITTAQAIGLSSIVGFLTIVPSTHSNSSGSSKSTFNVLVDILEIFAGAFLRGLLVLIVIYTVT